MNWADITPAMIAQLDQNDAHIKADLNDMADHLKERFEVADGPAGKGKPGWLCACIADYVTELTEDETKAYLATILRELALRDIRL